MQRFLLVSILVLMMSMTWAGGTKQSGLSDAFPLSNGLHYLYTYEHWNEYNDRTWSGWEATDSGTVEYHVLDSSITSDTSQAWTVEETRHLLHRHYPKVDLPPTYPPAFPPDSLYWIDFTGIILVQEHLSGLHKLQCSSLVWSFPFRDTLIGSGRDTSIEVFRYGVMSSQYLINIIDEPSSSGITDTLCFNPGQGLTARKQFKGNGTNVKTEYGLNIALISITTQVQPGDWNVPLSIELDQNYPNPFNPTTTIRYGLPSRSHVTLSVFNTLGQQVATLVNGNQEAGYHDAQFDGKNLSSGVYFYRIQAGAFVQTRKLLLVR